MAAREVPLVLSFFVIISVLYACSASFTPTDNYLINCGSSVNTTVGGRVFLADTSLSSTLKTPETILANTTASSVSSFDSSLLYQTARIFTGASSYSFQIQKQGRHFIRLYFFPFVYQSYNLTAMRFTVSTQNVILLTNFQPKSNSSPVFKEYSVNITHDTLVLSFVSSANLSFVNAIEVVSVPDDLITDSVPTVNPRGQYLGLAAQPLETVYRINMGIPKVLPESDTLWRTWTPDQIFIVNKSVTMHINPSGMLNHMAGLATEETAPDIVYSTATKLVVSNTSSALFNMTWQFNVDASSSYLIRFHLCDIISNAIGSLFFNIYVNSWVVARDFDFLTLTINNLATPLYMDFVLSSEDATDKITISIGPSISPHAVKGGILNGLEIMKMKFSSGSVVIVEPPSSKKNFSVILGLAIGASAVLIIVVVVVFILVRRRKLKKEHSRTWMPFSINGLTNHSTGTRTSKGTTILLGQKENLVGYRFSFTVLQEATKNFDENLVIGVGGFGKVYKGVLKDDNLVAVKRGNPGSQQGLNEFRTEIDLLSRLRHRHLVSLIGYCDERNEMILVYEYMEKGSLKSHLYGSDLPALSWKKRLEICIGAARGLHYLHTGSAKAIIHRDVKSANILLDENIMAKVADFGLSKTGPELDQTHVSTAVKGSFGYLDPEYFRRQQLTEKSDVYSFGVVLLEVLCARPVIDPTLPRDMVNLAEWAINLQKRGELHLTVDQQIAETIRPETLRKFGETAEKCLADCGVDRPTIGDVLWNLEYMLQLQEGESQNSEVNSINRIAELSSQVQNVGALESAATVEEIGVATVEGAGTSNENDLSKISMSRLFSQLIKSEGR